MPCQARGQHGLVAGLGMEEEEYDEEFEEDASLRSGCRRASRCAIRISAIAEENGEPANILLEAMAIVYTGQATRPPNQLGKLLRCLWASLWASASFWFDEMQSGRGINSTVVTGGTTKANTDYPERR